MKTLNILSLLVISLFTLGCSKDYLKKILTDNPDILAKAIEENPKEIIDALNKASIKFRQAQLEDAQKKREAQREAEFSNPKKPSTPSSRAYFGNVNAPITIVEYSDFQCVFCKGAHEEVLVPLLKEYEGKIRILYKHSPIDQIHPQAMLASQYYEAVAKLDKAKAKMFHDKLFEKQGDIRQGAKFLDKVVKEIGLSVSKVKAELDGVKSIIAEDREEARKFGFSGTPGFLVGGISLRGKQPYNEFKRVIDRLLEDQS